MSDEQPKNGPRRDFLNGMAIAVGASLLPRNALAGHEDREPQDRAGYYPPTLTGMRGSQPGSFEIAHSLRDGTFWQSAGKPTETGEVYDLVVVGGGISGLAAAHFSASARAGLSAFSFWRTTTTLADTPGATSSTWAGACNS